MSMSQLDLRREADYRIGEDYLIEQRDLRQDTHSDRMGRYDELDRIARGELGEVFPNESFRGKPTIMNQVQVELDDIARLVSENRPSIRVPPRGDSKTAEEKAAVKEAIAYGYWTYNRAERLIPQSAMDLAGLGMFAWLCYVKPGFSWPAIMRFDPRTCYPTILNGELSDLVTITKMRSRQLEALHDIKLGKPNDYVELIGYWDAKTAAEFAYHPSSHGGTWIAPPADHGLGMVPVAFGQLDSFDGAIRGMFDQIGGILAIKNRITNLILDNADQMVYSPIIEYDMENPGDYGPLAILHANTEKSSMGRLEPSSVSPQLFGLLQVLEGEARAGGGYPATRQGEVGQSIASASFVSSTMGQLTSTVRNIDRLIGFGREQANRIMFALDEFRLNFDKPLCRTVGGKKMYTPKKAIEGDYENEVVNPVGTGMDKANQYVLALQLKGAQLVSDETIMGELSEITDPVSEKDKIVREMMESALLQKFAAEAPLPMTMQAVALMGQGKSLIEVAEQLLPQAQQQQQQEQAAAAGQPAPQGGPPPEGGVPPEQVAAQQTGLEKGGVPGEAPTLMPDTSTVTLIGR